MKPWARTLRQITARRMLPVVAATAAFACAGGVAIASTSGSGQPRASQASAAAVGTGYAKHTTAQMDLSPAYKTYLSLQLPAGSYMVTARVELAPRSGSYAHNAACIVRASGARSDFDSVWVGAQPPNAPVSNSGGFADHLFTSDGTITAIRVASISYQS